MPAGELLGHTLELAQVIVGQPLVQVVSAPTCSTKPSGSYWTCSVTRLVVSLRWWNVTTPAWWTPATVFHDPALRDDFGELGDELLVRAGQREPPREPMLVEPVDALDVAEESRPVRSRPATDPDSRRRGR